MRDADLLRAVELCCRENDFAMTPVRMYSLPSTTDAQLATYGASGPRIAHMLGASDASVRSKLQRLARDGKVHRPKGDARGGAVCWWPDGLLDKLRAEWTPTTPSTT